MRQLHATLRDADYTGPLGVDALIYRAPVLRSSESEEQNPTDGELRLKPIIEMNPRYTMGRLALELTRFVTPGRCLSLELAPISLAPS